MPIPVLMALTIAQSLQSQQNQSAPTSSSGGVMPVLAQSAGAIGGFVSKLFGGGKKPKDPTGDGGVANATAINQQRDTILYSDIWKYYMSLGKMKAVIDANPGLGPNYLDPPAVDAFGTAQGTLAKINDAIVRLGQWVQEEPLYKKWADQPATIIGGTTDWTPRLLITYGYGAGNVPEAIRRANQALQIAATAESMEIQDKSEAQAARKVVQGGGSVTSSGALIPGITSGGPQNPGNAPTSDIAALTQSIQALLSEWKPGVSGPVAPAQPKPSLPADALAGFDFEAVKKALPIIAVLLMTGFIFSKRK